MNEQSFIDAIASDPHDITNRLVFCDWLADEGRQLEADMMRAVWRAQYGAARHATPNRRDIVVAMNACRKARIQPVLITMTNTLGIDFVLIDPVMCGYNKRPKRPFWWQTGYVNQEILNVAETVRNTQYSEDLPLFRTYRGETAACKQTYDLVAAGCLAVTAAANREDVTKRQYHPPHQNQWLCAVDLAESFGIAARLGISHATEWCRAAMVGNTLYRTGASPYVHRSHRLISVTHNALLQYRLVATP